ncbi:MAG: hypothetical protein CVU11_07680 [Bacteroidetes bacterium HGW-Bacteroidetes-6]|jgi:outer membrane protein OmpA-like peptidoglycan-associated protein/tetratricopeptide (TPR) repeat protein|nr:MAG: hypothetical protein CVU11_07680 [Bacteroidetes bacterium HGW-Bacteroidetes-6]
MKHLSVLILLLIVATGCMAQEKLSSNNKKAIKEYYKGMDAMEIYAYDDAEQAFLKAIAYDKKFVEPYIMLGTAYEEQKDYEKSMEYFEKSIEIDEDFFPGTMLVLARMQAKNGLYEKAAANYERYLKRRDIKVASRAQAEKGLEQCKFAIDQINHPRDFDPQPLGSGVNTENSEYMPALTADENVIIFTRLLPSTSAESATSMQEDFYTSRFVNGNWTEAVPLSKHLNSPQNEGAHTISPDGKTFFFTACNRESGKGSCDIYMSKWRKGDWDYPVNLYEINSKSWDSQPSISPDGKTLYFTSSRNGSMNIFVTHLIDEDTWSEPEMLPSPINTNGNEMAPFMHPDGKTLYFTSDGHLGMGGLDIFVSRKQADSTWSEPINIGYPINTSNDEAFLFVSASGDKAYFAGGGLLGQKMDIFSFDLYEEARPEAVTYMKGIVVDQLTQIPLSASFELTDLNNGNVVAASQSDETGSFLLCIPSGHDYGLNVSRDNYLFYSENFNLSGVHSKTDPFIKNVELQPIDKDAIVVLKNIFFDTDKFDLKPESFVELEKLIQMLQKNSKMKIEIRGHTDNTGGKEHNQQLSENRAKSVYNYLIGKGISASRLTYKGFGDTLPIETNDTPEGRASNRRTEFRVISN